MKENRYFRTGSLLVTSVAVVTLCLLWTLLIPSASFPSEKPFLVEEGENIKTVSAHLRQEGYIRSSLLFRALVSLGNYDTRIQTGYYSFSQGSSLLSIVTVFVKNGPEKPLASITIPEGSTESDIARIIRKELPSISEKQVLTAIHDQSAYGFLFPETYFLSKTVTASELVLRMMSLFAARYNASFNAHIKAETMVLDTKLRDEVSLAAILEKETNNETDMKIVAGILQKRLSVGMPLQVDVAKETYSRRGLPAAPIANPGIVALRAVREPSKTSYFYYVTGRDGTMHYAITFEEHKKNVQKYLK